MCQHWQNIGKNTYRARILTFTEKEIGMLGQDSYSTSVTRTNIIIIL